MRTLSPVEQQMTRVVADFIKRQPNGTDTIDKLPLSNLTVGKHPALVEYAAALLQPSEVAFTETEHPASPLDVQRTRVFRVQRTQFPHIFIETTDTILDPPIYHNLHRATSLILAHDPEYYVSALSGGELARARWKQKWEQEKGIH